MRYQYVVAYRTIGGLTTGQGESERFLYDKDGIRVSIAPLGNARLQELNQAYAVANTVLNRLLRGGPPGTFDDVVRGEKQRIEEEQKSQFKDVAILLIEMEGEVEVSLGKPNFECEEFAIFWEALTGQPILDKHRPHIDAIITGLMVSSPPGLALQQHGDRLWLREKSGRYAYSVRIKAQGEAATLSRLTKDIERDIEHYVDKARRPGSLAKVQHLLATLMAPEGDKLRAYISGWAALEIFTNQLYAAHQRSGAIRGHRVTWRSRALMRLRRILGRDVPDTLSLRFQAVAQILKRGAAVENDIQQFRSLKKIRDRFYHGTLVENRSLPNHDLATLLRDYLRAYLDTV